MQNVVDVVDRVVEMVMMVGAAAGIGALRLTADGRCTLGASLSFMLTGFVDKQPEPELHPGRTHRDLSVFPKKDKSKTR